MEGKADFTGVYNADDPRAYFAALWDLDYQAPAHGAPVFRRLLRVLGSSCGRPRVLDVCCSYGVNAALLNHDVSFDELRGRYRWSQRAGLARDELAAADRRFFAERRRADAAEVVGLDVAENAVGYAVEVGLLAEGLVADLEADGPLPGEVGASLADVDLVTVTGGASYVTERTFETIVATGGDAPPWIAALTLRWIGFDTIARALREHGLVTERIDGYLVRQRRFADEDERRLVHESLERRGVGLSAFERAGWHCAELFVARPEEAVHAHPIAELLNGDRTASKP